MARRQSAIEDLIEITSRLPWWVGITLAVVSYFYLHSLAMTEAPAAAELGKVGDMVKGQFVKTLATIGQYILPLAFTLGAIGSIFGRLKRRSLFSSSDKPNGKSVIGGMSWQEFEMLVGEAYRRKGYKVVETPSGADGGVDLVLTKDSEKTLVQCKHWRSRQVGVKVVRELFGVMIANGAEYGAVVTSGNFSQEAKVFASSNHIDLIDGNRLAGLIRSAKQPPAGAMKTKVEPPRSAVDLDLRADVAPHCPVCNMPMVIRTARRGDNTGKSFWGCPKFPKCRGTRESA
ncbi:MAG: restriction endonuclease [Gammaproteobacteria bacterium]